MWENMDVLLRNKQLPLARIMITLVLQVDHSNMKGNARQPLFPATFFSSWKERDVHIIIGWIFLL